MEPDAETPTFVWARSKRSIEEIAAEQGYRPPHPGDPPIVGFMDDEEWEAFTSAVWRWREESGQG